MTNKDKKFNEDIPQNTKSTVKRLFIRIARQKGKLALISLFTLLSSAAFTAMPIAMALGIDNIVTAIKNFDSTKSIVSLNYS